MTLLTADAADDLLSFIHASPTPWHAVVESVRRLGAFGFSRLDEGEAWSLQPGGRHFIVRGATILAFEVGSGAPHEVGSRWVGAHTDSPNLRLKPNVGTAKHGHVQLGVEVYGGVLLHTWLDRDLALAGRVYLRGAAGLETHLVRVDRPVARTPSLAIHLDRGVNTDGLVVNPQTHLPPVIALESAGEYDFKTWLLREVGQDGRDKADVLGWDLALYDAIPPTRGGARGEYLFAGRLDNLAMCHAAIEALGASVQTPHGATRGLVLYDHEECGSQSAQGAQSTILRDVMERIARSVTDTSDAFVRTAHRSTLISADMAHAIHPNYADKHEGQHAPLLGGGPVIKANANQRYATDGEGAARFALWCEMASVPVQRFVTRTDLACGSTIGPIASAVTGMKTIDVGNPMYSMHSIREMAAAADVARMIGAMQAFYSAT